MAYFGVAYSASLYCGVKSASPGLDTEGSVTGRKNHVTVQLLGQSVRRVLDPEASQFSGGAKGQAGSRVQGGGRHWTKTGQKCILLQQIGGDKSSANHR